MPSLYIANYKCFGPEPQGVEEITPITVVVGRNNSGKSSLGDVFEFAADLSQLPSSGPTAHDGRPPRLFTTAHLDEAELRRVFSENTSGGSIAGNHWAYGKRLIGESVRWSRDSSKARLEESDQFDTAARPFLEQVIGRKQLPLAGKQVRRIVADRDVRTESDGERPLASNGEGTTTVIRRFITESSLPRDLVKVTMLAALNEVFEPEATFAEIDIQRVDKGQWEVFLDESSKGSIALSQSGSGLKTVLIVLSNLLLAPHVEKYEPSDAVYIFEELENNLHPALQRRLFSYIARFAKSTGSFVCITTHSSAAIDFFNSVDAAQIVHVIHDGSSARIYPLSTDDAHSGALSDLGFRASDLLQANGIIWVEGPSDRVYLNRFIDLWTDGALVEGTHYQCVFFGGSLLAHLSADAAADTDRVPVLSINRNVALVADSDRGRAKDDLKPYLTRMVNELGRVGGMSWVTSGREIENYLPKTAVNSFLGVEDGAQAARWARYSDHLDSLSKGAGARYLRDKTTHAARVAPLIERNDLEGRLDASERISELVERIHTWN